MRPELSFFPGAGIHDVRDHKFDIYCLVMTVWSGCRFWLPEARDHKLMNHGMVMTELHHETFINTKMVNDHFWCHKKWLSFGVKVD
jgi:hypothetical protein